MPASPKSPVVVRPRRGQAAVFAAAVLALAIAPAITLAALPDEIGGDNFEGFDLTPCDAALTSDSTVAADYAAAMDLCVTTTEGSRAPGLIGASLTRADGTEVPHASSHSIRPHYGTGTTPRRGNALALLSTGTAAGAVDTSPSFVGPQAKPGLGFNGGTASAMPADWLAANSGTPPHPPGCPNVAGTSAFDSVLLKLRIRVPNNAHSFSFDSSYFASDFPELTCAAYNDYFVALLDSGFGNPLNPTDKNVAVSVAPLAGVPITVNLANAGLGLFKQCVNGATGCQSMSAGVIGECSGTSQLVGTGMDSTAGLTSTDTCGTVNAQVGGGTGWLTVRGNVVPGDVIELRLAIWDSGDHLYDSDVVLDNFRWAYNAVQAGAVSSP